MNEWTFRKARADELNALADLYERVKAHMIARGIDQWDETYPTSADIADDIAHDSLYVIADAGQILVSVAFDANQDAEYDALTWRYSGSPIGSIHRLVVDPAAQGRGLGRRAVECIEAEAAAAGFVAMRLDTYVKNVAALALYDSMDYERVGLVSFRDKRFQCFEKRLTR